MSLVSEAVRPLPKREWSPVGDKGLVLPKDGILFLAKGSRLHLPPERRIQKPQLEVLSHPEVARMKIEKVNPFAMAVDMRPLLDTHYPGWQAQVAEVAKAAPERNIVGGSVITSMVPEDTVTYYQPTNGLTIARELPWLYTLFKREIRHLGTRITGDQSLYLGNDLASSLNINYLREGIYELHVDRDPLTAILALETLEPNEGGELVLHERRNPVSNTPEGESFKIRPIAGIVYFINGLRHPHEVTELRRKKPRLVAAGDYYTDSVPEVIDLSFNEKVGVAK